MIKKILALLISFLCLNTKAQTNVYHPFPDSSAKWTQGYWYISGGGGPGSVIVTCPNAFYLAGDTIISTRRYKKILGSGYCSASGYPNANYFYNTYQGAIRQDSAQKKVYYCNASSTMDTLLYNFNLHVGDTLPVSYVTPFHSNKVSFIDSILVGTSYRKQYHINIIGPTSTYDTNYVSLIEGVGSTLGLTYQLTPPFESGTYLCGFTQNDSTLHISQNNTVTPPVNCDLTLSLKKIQNERLSTIQIYPNPGNGSFQLAVNNEQPTEIKIYDVSGKLVLSQSINGSTTIHASTLNEGVYTLSVSNKEGTANKKLIIIK